MNRLRGTSGTVAHRPAAAIPATAAAAAAGAALVRLGLGLACLGLMQLELVTKLLAHRPALRVVEGR